MSEIPASVIEKAAKALALVNCSIEEGAWKNYVEEAEIVVRTILPALRASILEEAAKEAQKYDFGVAAARAIRSLKGEGK